MARHGQRHHQVERYLLGHQGAVLAPNIDALLVHACKAVATDHLACHLVALMPCCVLSIFVNILHRQNDARHAQLIEGAAIMSYGKIVRVADNLLLFLTHTVIQSHVSRVDDFSHDGSADLARGIDLVGRICNSARAVASTGSELCAHVIGSHGHIEACLAQHSDRYGLSEEKCQLAHHSTFILRRALSADSLSI